MKKMMILLLIASVMPAFAAEPVPEHPLIRPYPGSVLAENMSRHNTFDVFEFSIMNPDTNRREKKAVKGEYWRLLYEVRNPDGSRVQNISKVEFLENYKAAAQEKGGQVLYDDGGIMTFMIPREDGGITYCQVGGTANLGQQDLVIVDEQPFKKSLTFGPAEMKAALDKDGRVLLYDILFDLDKATLKPESTKQLQHVVTLLLDHPELQLEVQGHTDSQGSDEYNLDLSQRRAETVVSYLTLFGVAPSRLTPKGYGESKPVAPNDTEEGRAKNRRVELVKADAIGLPAAATPQGALTPGPDPTTTGEVNSYRAAIKMHGVSKTGAVESQMKATGTMEGMRKGDATVYRVELDQEITMAGQQIKQPMLTIFDGTNVFVQTTTMGQTMAMKMKPDQQSTVIASGKDEALKTMAEQYGVKQLPDGAVNGEPATVYEITMKAAPAGAMPGAAPPFARGEIYFSKETELPLRWVMYADGDTPLMTIDYTSYEINPDLSNDRFVYAPPAGVTVMDMTKMPMMGGQ